MATMTVETPAGVFQAELFDTPTAEAIRKAMPLEGAANRWGDEIYFEVPVYVEQEPGAREEVGIGDLGYWPVGNAVCIFFGPTPASRGSQPRAASPVNVFGKIAGNPATLGMVHSGDRIILKLP